MTRLAGPVDTRAPIGNPPIGNLGETMASEGPSAAGSTPSTASTIETARPLTAHEPKEFCDRVTVLFKDMIDMVSSVLFSLFNWVRALVSKGEGHPVLEAPEAPETGVNPPSVTPALPSTGPCGPRPLDDLVSLQNFRGWLESGVQKGDMQVGAPTRDQVLSSFYQGLTNAVQEDIKLRMWELVRQDIDPSNLRSNDRQGVLNWADRALRGEVRIESEVDDRADIVPYVNILDGNSILRHAIDDSIRAAAVAAGHYRLSGGLSPGNPEFERVVYSAIDYFDRCLPVAVQEAIGLKIWEFAQQDGNPNRPPVPAIQQREERVRWAMTILQHRPFGSAVAGQDERMPSIVYYSGTLRHGNNIFFRAIDAVIAEGGENAVHARRLLDRIDYY